MLFYPCGAHVRVRLHPFFGIRVQFFETGWWVEKFLSGMNENPEREILLKLLRGEPVTAVTMEQWHGIVRLSKQHGVESILYRQLNTPGWKGRLPPETWQTLRTDYMHEASQYILLFHELGKILSALHQADIPVIPLKGAFLAEQIYSNIALRPMVDLDLLVRQADLWKVNGILTRMGYVRLYLGEAGDAGIHVTFEHAQLGYHVEIHWNLIQEALGLHVDIQEVWKRTQPATVAGVEVAAMPPEDLILHLCMHASDHIFEMGLRAVYDITETLRHYQKELNWVDMQKRASLWRVNKCAYVHRNLISAT
jgi:hypothetical protein